MFKDIHSRRTFLKGLGAAGGSILLSPFVNLYAMEGEPPCPEVAGRRISWIVPGSVGGGYDTYSRLIEPFYERALVAEIVVENRPGAGGVLCGRIISEAKPDGLTIGIINAPALMTASLVEEKNAPNPAKDFTILGRVAGSRHVWLTGRNSSLNTIEDVLKKSEKRPVVFAIVDVGSSSFVGVTISSYLSGVDSDLVAGFNGSRECALAAIRGDVDVISFNFESVLSHIENGDLRPLMQLTDEVISSHPSLKGVPLLGGEEGVAARRAAGLGRSRKEAVTEARALSALIGAGRLIVAPPGLDKTLSICMEKVLTETLTSAGFRDAAAKAKRSLDIADGKTSREDLRVVTEVIVKFASLIMNAIKDVRK